MNDLEISKALALAIGWPKDKVAIHNDMWEVMVQSEPNPFGWRIFNHMDLDVIGPIAERYECSPKKCCHEWYVPTMNGTYYADSPQKAIALAVIQGAKK